MGKRSKTIIKKKGRQKQRYYGKRKTIIKNEEEIER